ncbi:MAG: hypothetical protein ACK5P7_02115 [Bdellovibrio sp.]
MKTRKFFLSRVLPLGLTAMWAFLSLSACGGSREMSEEERLRAESCPPVEASHEFEETPFRGGTEIIYSFQNVRATINSACASCHQSPAKNGGFTYLDSWEGAEVLLSGERTWIGGFRESAEQMRDSLLTEDPVKKMPPLERRQKNPEAFLELGRQLNLWIAAGKPNGTFRLGKAPEPPRGKPRPQKPQATSELGDCVPKAKLIGFDYQMDRVFENAKTLPKYLNETDMFTLDSYELAKKGTLAYNVEYPLWADNANKGRWIHVPMAIKDGKLVKQTISYDGVTKQFKIPDNTRFYKSFYRAVTLPNKKIKMRRMETRIIVVRTPWENSLFGTYQWDETEQVAMLVEAPYRDGTPWKDLVLDVVVDESKMKMRPYAIPGRQRCMDCHMGSPSKNFVLGFDPLQINKRPWGGAGRLEIPAAHDMDQVSRFIDYGLLSGIRSAEDLPVLENSGRIAPRNAHELRANGYAVGNCFHCHNAQGLAFTKENGIQLPLGPGDLFNFNTQQKSVQITTRRLVHQNGDLDSSHIWRKVVDPAAQQGMFSQMPMHTPGSPDCHVMTVMGKWIRSFESEEAAQIWEPNCKKENPFHWIDMDFTWVQGETYVPRRNDWKSTTDGMPEKYRRLQLTPSLEQAIRTEYAVGHWNKKPQCSFPERELAPEARRPWMYKDKKMTIPKRPLGEIYTTTPGSYFYRNTCLKCHGPKGDGDTSLARGILNWSGGGVRVANFVDGMFGQKNENLKTFDLDGRNLGGNYLIWMAMEGTRVRFPPEISSFMGKHGGQMLNGIREKCLAQISSDKPSSPNFTDHEIFNKVCFMDNLEPGHPDLKFDPQTNRAVHPERVEEWLDRGAWNAGWAIFEFLKEGSSGTWRAGNDSCESVFPK